MNANYSFGFWKKCNTTKTKEKNALIKTHCDKLVFKSKILKLSRSIYLMGFSFQLIATFLILILLVINHTNRDFARFWNLYVIFCSTVLTFFMIGLLLCIINVILFLSKSDDIEFKDYEITYKSTSFFSFVGSLILSFLVIALVMFSLSFLIADFVNNCQ